MDSSRRVKQRVLLRRRKMTHDSFIPSFFLHSLSHLGSVNTRSADRPVAARLLYLQQVVKRSVGLLLCAGTAFPSAFVFFSAAAERRWESRGSDAGVGLQIHGQRPPSLREKESRRVDDGASEGWKKTAIRRQQLPQGGDTPRENKATANHNLQQQRIYTFGC